MSKNTIDRETTIGQVLRMNPEAGKLLKDKFNLGCLGCGGAEHETLANGAIAHGLDVEDLIRELKTIL